MNKRGKSLKRFMLITAITAAMVTLAACGGGKSATLSPNASNNNSTASPTAAPTVAPTEMPKEKVVLKAISFGGWIKDGMNEVVKDAADQLGIDLQIEKAPEGADGIKLVKTRFATNDKPDLLFWSAGMDEAQGLGNVPDVFVKQDGQPWMDNFDKNAWLGAMDTNGEFYGAPYAGATLAGVLYNKKVFQSLNLQIPTTMDEFWSVSDKLKKAGKTPVFLSGKDSWTLQIPSNLTQATLDQHVIWTKIMSNQASFTDFATQKKGLVFLTDVISKGDVNKNFLSDSFADAVKALANGDAGMYLNATWTMPEIIKSYPDNVNDIGMFAFPTNGDGKDIIGVYAPNSMYILQGKNQKAAQKFVNFFESLEELNKFFAKDGGIPAIKGVTGSKLTPAEMDAKAILDAGRGVSILTKPDKGVPNYGIGDFAAMTQNLAAGGMTPDQVLQAEEKEVVKNAKAKADPNFK